jgi:hypothetical protein
MRELRLSDETRAVFDRIREHAWTLHVYGMRPSRALWLVRARTESRINKAGVTSPGSNFYRRYLNELVRTFRTETGDRLIQAIELAIRKWANLGLDPALLQGLLGDCFLRFEQQGYAGRRRKRPVCPAKPARRRHGSYEQALRQGRAALHGGNTLEEQARLQREGSARAADIARRLKPVLAAGGVSGRGFIPYFNFAQQLGRLARKYADKTLQAAASDLIDYYEAKALDPATLRAIAATLFGVAGRGRQSGRSSLGDSTSGI